MMDFLIVGAGITGATIARLLTDVGYTCRVIDSRDHIGGNCYDVPHDDYYINQYGGHIFHTNNDAIWEFVNRFGEWIPYEHRVKANYRGEVYSLPPNKLTMTQLHLNGNAVHAESVIKQTFFAGYSFKQWGMDIAELPNGILSRIPIRQDYDDRYFSDKYQAMPKKGYTALIKKMLMDIPTETGTAYTGQYTNARQVIYTGSLDALYEYEYGRLPYRSLHWETEFTSGGIGCATMNYTDYQPGYTRQMEWQYFGHRQRERQYTAVTTEYPEAWNGENVRCYPINTPENNALYKQYEERAKADGLLFAGRLASYQYLDMHQAIGQGMVLVKRLLNGC